MAKAASSGEARRPWPLPEPPGHTRNPWGRGGGSGDLCAPRVGCRVPPDAPRAAGPLRPTSQTLEPGAHAGRRRPRPGCTTRCPFPWRSKWSSAPGAPWAPNLQPHSLSHHQTTSQARDGSQARAGGVGLGPPLRPGAKPRPSRHLRASSPQPPDFSPPTPRLLCCSSSLGFLECTGLAEPSAAPPPPRLGEGLAEGGKRRGGDARKEERGPQPPWAPKGTGQGALVTPPAILGQEMGGNRGPVLRQGLVGT